VTVGYQMEVVYFSWVPDPVEVEEGLDIPQFSLVGTELNDCSNNYTAGRPHHLHCLLCAQCFVSSTTIRYDTKEEINMD